VSIDYINDCYSCILLNRLYSSYVMLTCHELFCGGVCFYLARFIGINDKRYYFIYIYGVFGCQVQVPTGTKAEKCFSRLI